MTEPTLFPVSVVNCFFRCGHVVRDPDPEAAGQAMERHYSEKHDAQITRIIRFGTPEH